MDRLLEISAELTALAEELTLIAANPEEEDAEERMAKIDKRSKLLIEERGRLIAERARSLEEGFNRGTNVNVSEPRSTVEERSRLGTDLVSQRSITLDGNLTLVVPENHANNIIGTFNQVSPLIDRVTYTDMNGGETYKRPYMKSYGEAGVTAEGADYHDTTPVFGHAEIVKVKITAYTEISREFRRLAPEFYYDEVVKNLRVSIRKTMAQQIILGAGGTTQLMGIFAPANKQTNIEASKDLEISKIDENTLTTIALSYGGDEDITDGVLILNKADLLAFANVRGSDKKPVYEINFERNTINNIPYVISSAVKAFATAAAGDYVMGYGSLSQYEVGVFSDIDVAESNDYKFQQGMIALRAEVMVGGNVVGWNAFLRVKKSATPEGK